MRTATLLNIANAMKQSLAQHPISLDFHKTPERAMCILAEEMGEAVQAMLDYTRGKQYLGIEPTAEQREKGQQRLMQFEHEMYQVLAVATFIVESLNKCPTKSR